MKERFRRIIALCLLASLLGGFALFGGCKAGKGADAAVSGRGIMHEEEFGGVYIDLTIDEFNALGFACGDSVDVAFSNGYRLEGIPYYSGYYTRNGEPLLVAYPGYPYIKVCINNGDDLWTLAALSESDRAEIKRAEQGAFLDIQNARDLHYADDRAKFGSDAAFANFRSVKSRRIQENMLYRSASPCDNQHNRAPCVDALIAEAGVQYIVNLADNEEKIRKYLEEAEFDPPCFLSLYKRGR